MLDDDARNILYQDYTASMLGTLAQTVAQIGGASWTAPSFIEMVYPDVKDTRSSKEIKDDLLSRLTGG